MGFILPFIVSQFMGASKPVKILAGAYLAGAVASGVKSYIDGDTAGNIAKKSAFSWGGLVDFKRFKRASDSTRSKSGKSNRRKPAAKKTKKLVTKKKIRLSKKHQLNITRKARITRKMKVFMARTDVAARRGDTKAVLKTAIEMQSFLKKERAPKRIMTEVSAEIRLLKREIAKEAKAKTTAPATEPA